jgi:hypothetical protein
MASPGHSTQRSRRVAAAVGLTAALAGGSAAVAIAGGLDATIIGHTPSAPKPACPTPNVENPPPEKACQVMGRVTGFQLSADGRKNPYRVRRAGRIVAWSVDLSRPNKEERAFFANELSHSGPPTAGLAILRQREGGTYKLLKKTPTVDLAQFYGEKPIFTLADPLRVKEGVVVALTTPTWIPNLGIDGASRADRWRASRDQGQCGDEPGDPPSENEADLLERSRPHLKVDGDRDYACDYRGARLLYWAYLAAGGGGGGGPGGGN